MINPTKHGLHHPLGLTAAAALAGVLACSAVPAASAQSVTGETVRVSISDLDMANASGVRQLLHRIRKASVKVCTDQDDDPLYRTEGGYFGCINRTTAVAIARADIPQLTALYQGRRAAVVLAKGR